LKIHQVNEREGRRQAYDQARAVALAEDAPAEDQEQVMAEAAEEAKREEPTVQEERLHAHH